MRGLRGRRTVAPPRRTQAAFQALEMLTRYRAAKEFGCRGIRADTVSPGEIGTGLGGAGTFALAEGDRVAKRHAAAHADPFARGQPSSAEYERLQVLFNHSVGDLEQPISPLVGAVGTICIG